MLESAKQTVDNVKMECMKGLRLLEEFRIALVLFHEAEEKGMEKLGEMPVAPMIEWMEEILHSIKP